MHCSGTSRTLVPRIAQRSEYVCLHTQQMLIPSLSSKLNRISRVSSSKQTLKKRSDFITEVAANKKFVETPSLYKLTLIPGWMTTADFLCGSQPVNFDRAGRLHSLHLICNMIGVCRF